MTRLIAHRMAREAKVVAAMQKLGPATLDALVPVVYEDVSPRLYPVAARSLSAHLDKLMPRNTARSSRTANGASRPDRPRWNYPVTVLRLRPGNVDASQGR